MHVSKGTGGGRGLYHTVSGDVPICMGQRIRQDTSVSLPYVPKTERLSLLEVFSFNADGMGDDTLQNFFVTMSIMEKGWDAVLIQEGPRSEVDTVQEIEGGHVWCVARCEDRPRSVAILLHRRWKDMRLCFESPGSRVCFVDINMGEWTSRLISVHLPHTQNSDIEYEQRSR